MSNQDFSNQLFIYKTTDKMQLQRATRKKVKIKIAISSPTGFGKTYSALLMAYGITGDWSKIAVIDSENESASLYSDLGGENTYFTIPMPPPYTVDRFCQAIDTCIAGGIEVIIVDSTYHYWHGKGGLLEYNNSLGNNSFANWAKTNPVYNKWLDKILQSPAHFICTSRKKQAYEIVEANGKKTVEKKGMEDQIRDGFDYEMTIAFNIVSANHLASASKDRTRMFSDAQEFVITEETGKKIIEWCELGEDIDAQVKDAIKKLANCDSTDDLKTLFEMLPIIVRSDERYLEASKARKKEITAPKQTT